MTSQQKTASSRSSKPTTAKDNAVKPLETSPDEMRTTCLDEGVVKINNPARSFEDDSSAIFNQSSGINHPTSTSNELGSLTNRITDINSDYKNDITANKDDTSLVAEVGSVNRDERRSHSKLFRQQAWFTESLKNLSDPVLNSSVTKSNDEQFDLFVATGLTNHNNAKKPMKNVRFKTKSADEKENDESRAREGSSSSTDNVYLCLHSSKPGKEIFFPVKSFPNLRCCYGSSNGAFAVNAGSCQDIVDKKFNTTEINFGNFNRNESMANTAHALDSGESDSHLSNSEFNSNCCNCQFSSPLLNSSSNNEFHSANCKENSLAQMLANSLAFFNIKIPDSLPLTPSLQRKSKSFFSKYRSKSLTSLYDNSDEDNEDVSKESFHEASSKKPTKSFHLPSFHFFSTPKNEEENIEKADHNLSSGRMSIDVKNFQAGNPAATLLLFPPKLSGAPAIFLRQDTPNNSNTPVESPIRHANRTFESSLVCLNNADNVCIENASCIEEVMKLKDDSESKPKFSLRDEDDSADSPKVSPNYFGGLKNRITKRPTLLLPQLGSSNDSEPESPSRRNSVKSTLSVSSPTRRPSLSSLLSASSLSLAGHRFSFNLGSRSDQMVSVSFKSLESFVTEDNLLGLQAFLASRAVVIDDRDENGASVLILCATKGKEDFCKALLDHGADVNAEDNDNWTALTAAAKEGHASVVQTLLDHDASVDHRDLGGWTSLLWACYKGHLQTVKTLLAHRADPNVQGQHHMSPLVWAAGRGHTEVVKELLAKGAKVSLGDKFGTTPLIWACRKGFIEISEDLLRHGSNVDAAGMYSWTPLLVATRGNYVDLVNLLLEYKPNVNALDKDGGTALTIACKEGYSEISSALLRAGAYVNIQDRNGDSNLIFACRGGHKRVVESLLKKHADIDCVGKDRKTAIYWAVEKNHIMVVKLLLSVNADLEHATKDGDTVLLRAVRAKNADIVQMLVDKKIRVSVADKKGDTALHIAMRGRSKRIVEILLRNPKNSQILYRPNKSGETPYNIDLSHQKTILGQIFGARRLNTNEENENMLGYDLYSSSLADILSEPSLSMPISVGLYARWGSGKSFLIRKLREEMNNFARQWVEPLFQFSALVFTVVVFISFMLGFITHLSTKLWYVGLATGGGVFLLIILILVAIWYGSRSKYDWHLWYRWSVGLACHTADFKLVSQVIFCSPPGDQWKEWKDGVQAKPLKFIFAEGSKPSSTGAGGSSVIQILGSLFTSIEDQYGIFSTRFFRAFRPKPHGESSPWKFRRLCGIPYIVIFFTTFACSITLTYLAVTYGFHSQTVIPVQKTLEVSKDQKSLQKREVIEPKFEIELPKFIVKRNVFRPPEDDEDDDDDENEEEDESERKRKGEKESDGGQALHGQLINPLLFILSGLVALVVVANIHTLVRMVKALIFSHRRHLVSAISKFDTMSAEGYIPTLKSEVDLMVDMVKCLDAFTFQQTRLVVILDGLDSCEQDKVLSVLDAVHSLFTDSNGPFIILLAIDPHIISRAIEMNANKVFREATISGHDYLRNIIHLPFYLQNAGLRKVKLAEQASELLKSRTQNLWNEQETEFVSLATTSVMGGLHHMPVTRHMSSASELGYNIGNRRMSGESGAISLARRNTTKNSRRLKPSDSIGSSIGSNLNRVSAASDLNKVLLTDDYFNDINPRSMRRLMNVVYITGRLLKAFHIEFNWYHLALWVNITEQWPYRASWLIHYYERREDSCDDKTNLKDLYERVKSQMPSSKEVEPLLEMDRDERKFETFLSMHENILHIFNMVIFLPFTINLDPYIKKKIKEDELQMDEAYPRISPPNSMQWHLAQPPPIDTQSRSSTLSWPGKQVPNNKQFGGTLPPTLNPLLWGYGGPFANNTLPLTQGHYNPLPLQAPINMNSITLPAEAENKKLSTLSVDEIFELLGKVDGVSTSLMPTYQEKLKENNINGKVLLHCNLDDLKQILKMTFGDWELFRMLIVGLREQEFNSEDDLLNKNIKYFSANTFADNHRPLNNLESLSSEQSDSSIIMDGIKKGTHRGSFSSREREDSISLSRRNIKHNIHAKQNEGEEEKTTSSFLWRESHFSEMPSLEEQLEESSDIALENCNEIMNGSFNENLHM